MSKKPTTMITIEDRFNVPMFPIDNTVPEDIIATFKPAPERVTRSPTQTDGKKSDDPRRQFDNHPSDLPWDDTGRFHSQKEMKKLINANPMPDSGFGVAFGYLLTVVTCGGWLLVKRKAIPEGKYRIVRKSLHHEIRLAGHYSLASFTSKWGAENYLDDERSTIVEIGNKSIVNVPVNHIGVAYLVGNKEINDDRGNVQVVKDKDIVLFSQGSYVLDESRYRGIQVSQIDPNSDIMHIGPVTILQIGPEEIGGAKNRGTQQYHIFQTGAPLLFDNKEWTDYQVVKRTSDTFKVGPYTFLTLTGREYASVVRKEGSSLLLTDKATYKLHSRDWQRYVKKDNDDNVDLDQYYIRTIDEDHVATVRHLPTGKYFELKPGKYHLKKMEWEKPDIAKLDEAIVKSGPYRYLRVQNDFFTGSRNARTGEFIEFTEVGKIHRLHVKEFPQIDRVERVCYVPKAFGPYIIITIPDGMWGIFEEGGEIKVNKPGTYKLQPGTKVLETLPNRPQRIMKVIRFTTSDRYNLQGTTIFHLDLQNPKSIAQELRSREKSMKSRTKRDSKPMPVVFKFEHLLEEIGRRCVESLTRLLRQRTLKELAPTEEKERSAMDEIEKNCEVITVQSLKELEDFSKRSSIGISFSKVEVAGGFVLIDTEVIQNYGRLAKLQLEERVAKVKKEKERLQTEIIKEKIKRDKEIALTRAEQDRDVNLKKKEGELLVKKKEIENEQLVQKTKLDMDLLAKKNEAEARKIKLQIDVNEEQKKADAAAYSIKKRADAENYAAELRNKVTKNRPQILDEIAKLEKYSEFAQHFGKSAWNNPDIMNVLKKKMEMSMGDYFVMSDLMKGGFKKKS